MSTRLRALLCVGLCACGGGQLAAERAPEGFAALDGTRWAWVGARCDDGEHRLDTRGFDDRLAVVAIGNGLRLTHRLSMSAQGCAETLVSWVSANGAVLQFAEQARVADAADRGCADAWPAQHVGEIRQRSDGLEVRVHRSELCGGYDIRHNYRPLTDDAIDDHGLIRELLVGLSLRDPDLAGARFAVQASLVMPKPAREGGGTLRFEGNRAIRGFLTGMLRSVAWIATRVVEIADEGDGRYAVRAEYMDSELGEPLTLLLKLTIADREIYEAQWLFASPITPRTEPTDAGTALPEGGALPDTGAP